MISKRKTTFFQSASKAKNGKTSDRDQRLSTHKMSAVLSHSINYDTRANIESFLKEKEEKGTSYR